MTVRAQQQLRVIEQPASIESALTKLIDEHASARDLRQGTVHFYRSQVAPVVQFCEERQIASLADWTREDAHAFVAWLNNRTCLPGHRQKTRRTKKTWSARSINMALSFTRRYFNYLVEIGEIDRRPLVGTRNGGMSKIRSRSA